MGKAPVADDAHVAVEVTYGIYQRLIVAHQATNSREGKIAMYHPLRSIRSGVPTELPDLAQLGRSFWKRHREILAYLDIGAANGAVEAINGGLEHLPGIALEFRNLGHHILRSLIHSGGLQARSTHAQTERALQHSLFRDELCATAITLPDSPSLRS